MAGTTTTRPPPSGYVPEERHRVQYGPGNRFKILNPRSFLRMEQALQNADIALPTLNHCPLECAPLGPMGLFRMNADGFPVANDLPSRSEARDLVCLKRVFTSNSAHSATKTATKPLLPSLGNWVPAWTAGMTGWVFSGDCVEIQHSRHLQAGAWKRAPKLSMNGSP
uniref:Uncharacterized protein n=1 Tax=Candidatus Kentrum sp. LFY TaxID=2126342 RepID=A0A450WA67_9GAMM|nr:MAG: hypothetical protein BECKLFY1418C_GA0070996_10053 [Candidatus Kentron sp. LFY]